MGKLAGKSIIVTGAARGIGEVIAQTCIEEGAQVLVVDADPHIEEVAEQIGAVAVVGDLTTDGLAEQTVAEAVERHGTLDGLVNNAALVLEGDLLGTDMDNWRQTMQLNLEVPFAWCKAALPVLLAKGDGSIVNISSTEGIVARPNHFSYVTSKAGLGGLTRSIAIDFGRRGIRCNNVSPGSIDSERFREYVEGPPRARGGADLVQLPGTRRPPAGGCGLLRLPALRRLRLRHRRRLHHRRREDGR